MAESKKAVSERETTQVLRSEPATSEVAEVTVVEVTGPLAGGVDAAVFRAAAATLEGLYAEVKARVGDARGRHGRRYARLATVVEDAWLQARHGAHEAHYGQGEHETHDGQGGEGGTVRMREVGPERRAERLGRGRP